MTEWDEEEERKRSVKFVDNVIPDTRAQLKVCSKSYQVSYVQSSITLLQDYRKFDFSFVTSRWCFLFSLFVLPFWFYIISNYTKHKQWKTYLYKKNQDFGWPNPQLALTGFPTIRPRSINEHKGIVYKPDRRTGSNLWQTSILSRGTE